MAKHLLDSNEDDLDFSLIGITCPDDQYSVVSALDEALHTRFRLSDYLSFNLRDDKIFRFSLFRHSDPALGIDFYLLPNNSNFEEPGLKTQDTGLFAGIQVDQNLRLVRELSKVDYFILVKGDERWNHQQIILEKIRGIPEIVRAVAIDAAELPSRRNLIF